MGRFVRYLSIVLLFASQAHADGLYEIHGTNSKFGEYTGQAWIHGTQAQRLIRWNTYQYAPDSFLDRTYYEVENIWSGEATESGLHFELKTSNALTSFEGYEATRAQFENPTVVSIPFAKKQESANETLSFAVSGEEGAYQETWNRVKDAPAEPLWKNLRQNVDSTGMHAPWYYRILLWLGLEKVIDWYRAQPEAQAYQNHEEYQSQKQYFIQDRTDADFYSTHPQVLRVTNKTLNPLSLAEALMRRNAYAPKLYEKAELLGAQTLKNNLNEAGLLEFALVNEAGEKIGRAPEFDSALWTGMYGWSELMRYQVTKAPDALSNFRKILEGALTLIEITGEGSQTFARTVAISPASEELGKGWIQGTGKHSHLKWRTGGNNDMLNGVFVTLALAHQVIGPEETDLRKRIAKASRALLGTKGTINAEFNRGIAHGLIALWSDDPSEKEDELHAFSNSVYNLVKLIADRTRTNGNAYFGAVADWSGIHLMMVATFCQIFVAQELQKEFKGAQLEYIPKAVLKDAQWQLADMQKIYRESHRDFLTLMTFAFAPQTRNDLEFRHQAEEALWTLREFPAPRFIGSATVDLTKFPEWSLSAWPRLPWKGLKGVGKLKESLDFGFFAEGAYSYPSFELSAWNTDYLWKDAPFDFRIKSDPHVQVFSADYLLVYWASRASGLISAQD